MDFCRLGGGVQWEARWEKMSVLRRSGWMVRMRIVSGGEHWEVES